MPTKWLAHHDKERRKVLQLTWMGWDGLDCRLHPYAKVPCLFAATDQPTQFNKRVHSISHHKRVRWLDNLMVNKNTWFEMRHCVLFTNGYQHNAFLRRFAFLFFVFFFIYIHFHFKILQKCIYLFAKTYTLSMNLFA